MKHISISANDMKLRWDVKLMSWSYLRGIILLFEHNKSWIKELDSKKKAPKKKKSSPRIKQTALLWVGSFGKTHKTLSATPPATHR